jgi:hypothetical protein
LLPITQGLRKQWRTIQPGRTTRLMLCSDAGSVNPPQYPLILFPDLLDSFIHLPTRSHVAMRWLAVKEQEQPFSRPKPGRPFNPFCENNSSDFVA